MRKIILALLALITIAIIGIIIYAKLFSHTEQRFTGTLQEIVPAKLAGWDVVDVPLADSPGMLNFVKKNLEFDQYVSRRFTKGALSVAIYIAYWEPNKRSPIDAGGHNPDACWVNFGWTRLAREYSVAGTKIRGRELQPYEFGIYQKDSAIVPTIFWHLVNGKSHAYSQNHQGWQSGIAGVVERIPNRIEDLKRLGLNQRREQMYINLSFQNQHLENVLANPDFQDLMNKIDAIGIFEDRKWGDKKNVPEK